MAHENQNKPGVLFDMDGVLVDSNPVHKELIRTFCSRYGKRISESFFLESISGRTNREWIPLVFPEKTIEDVDRLADEKEQLFRETFEPAAAVTPGLLPFLKELRSNRIPMAVATSAPEENAVFILNHLRITPFFDAVLHAAHVARGKPHPEIYIKSSRAIGLEPAQCVVFEDSVAGVTAGRKAGARVIGVTGTHTREEFGACSKVIASFEEIAFSDLIHL